MKKPQIELKTRLQLLLARWTHKQNQAQNRKATMVRDDKRSRDTMGHAKLEERITTLQEARAELNRVLKGEMPPGLNIAWNLEQDRLGFSDDPLVIMRSLIEQQGYEIDPKEWAAMEQHYGAMVDAAVQPIYQVDYLERTTGKPRTVKLQAKSENWARDYVNDHLGEVTKIETASTKKD